MVCCLFYVCCLWVVFAVVQVLGLVLWVFSLVGILDLRIVNSVVIFGSLNFC